MLIIQMLHQTLVNEFTGSVWSSPPPITSCFNAVMDGINLVIDRLDKEKKTSN